MPKKESVANKALEQLGLSDGLAIFADRDNERAILARFFETLEQEGMQAERPILSFYGVGGVGKTTLLQKAMQEFTQMNLLGDRGLFHRVLAEWQSRHSKRLRIAMLNIDDDQWTSNTDPEKFFRMLRGRLADLGIGTPLLDLMLLAYWQKSFPGQELKIQSSPLEEYCSKAKEYGEVLGAFSALVADGVGSIGNIALINRLVGKLRDHRRSRELMDLIRLHPDDMTSSQQIMEMPRLLGADIEAFFEAQPKTSLCIAIDGFERIQTAENRENVQRQVVHLCEATLVRCRSPDTRLRLGYLIAGRERLRWRELYDDAATPDTESWNAYIDSHLLGGLAKADALAVLKEKAAGALERAGDKGKVAATMIRQYSEDILRAAGEGMGKDPESYYPYYLYLAVDLVIRSGTSFVPSMLGTAPDELQKRFLRYLSDHNKAELCTLQSLSLCLYFDQEIFSFLLREQEILGYRASDFSRIVKSERSYISALPDREGFYHFHRHMQQALVADQTRLPESRGAAEETVKKLLGWLVDRSRFAKPADFTETNGRAYEHGVAILLNAGQAKLLSSEAAISWFEKFEQPFDGATFGARRLPGQRGVHSLLVAALGAEHRSVLKYQGFVAGQLSILGQSAEALALGRSTLAAYERLHLPDHFDTLSSLHNLANTFFRVGQLAEAEIAASKALEGLTRVCGKDDRATLSTASTLSLILWNLGKTAEAEELSRKTLQARELKLGPDDADTLHSVENFAILSAELGNHQEAKPLFQRCLDFNLNHYGASNHNTLQTMGNLAYEHYLLGEYEVAEPLFKEAYEGILKIYGADHSDTLNQLFGYALVLKKSGDDARANPLLTQALGAYAKATFTIHSDTMHELGLFALEERDQVTAEAWLRKALESREQQYGGKHPATLASAGKVLEILRERSDAQVKQFEATYFEGPEAQSR